jgi:hypothetical protein
MIASESRVKRVLRFSFALPPCHGRAGGGLVMINMTIATSRSLWSEAFSRFSSAPC